MFYSGSDHKGIEHVKEGRHGTSINFLTNDLVTKQLTVLKQ